MQIQDPLAPSENTLLRLVRKQVVAQFGEAWFLRQWAWPNPEAHRLRLKLPHWAHPAGHHRHPIDLRIRPTAALLSETALPDHLRPEVTRVGCWSFDGVEQMAMTDFRILVLEKPTPSLMLPTLALPGYLRYSVKVGRL